MAYTAAELWLTGTAGDGSNSKFQAIAPSVANQSIANFGTSTSFRWLQLTNSATTSGAGDAAPQEGVDQGFNILAAEMHDVGAVHSRLIPAGIWTFEILVNNSALDINSGFAEAAYVYRRAAGGGLTLLFSVTSANHTIVELITEYTLASASQPKYLFAPGETLQVEFWVRGKGVAVTGLTRTLRRGSDLTGQSRVTVPGGGIFNSFTRANTDVAPAADTLDEQYAANRPITDATVLIESTDRAIVVARSLDDAAPALDDLDRALSYPRALADNAPAVDGGVVRTLTANRPITDVTVTSDSLDRAATVSRELSDNAPAVDTLTRSISANRELVDDLTTGGGAVTYRSVMVFED